MAQPVDAEQPPRLPFPVVGIGASAGGLEAFTEFFQAMPDDSGMAFVLVQHLPPDRESMIAQILSKSTPMPVHQVRQGMSIQPNQVYVIRPGHTLTLSNGVLHLGPVVDTPRHGRPVDDFFKSLAMEQRERSMCIVMSGMGSNGTAGAQAVKAVGGLCIAQDPDSALFPSMPQHLIDAGYPDFILRPSDMPDALVGFASHPYSSDRDKAEHVLHREESHVREILAVLRTQTQLDFAGYKKPTIVRRVQRRMSLNRVTKLGEYAKILRQSPVEVNALADDLLIHVTGFFRDGPAWDTLQKRAIAPLIEGLQNDGFVRCWVTACASGEEAYSLAILLVEECERQNKSLDIKIFATDTAERTLANARNGVFPGGIEAEMTPERLERFFTREDAVYRVRQDLREKVIFAPQNVLRDPPFSRLDIVTCRNLLIYLEPEVQQRLITLLHFGLREGGILFLGTSETIAGSEEMFETIDKRARLYRRVGQARHRSIELPLPHGLVRAPDQPGTDLRVPRPTVAQATARALLARHVPAAVTVDRDYRVVDFHGSTTPYLRQPTGEPTRELFSLISEPLRGPVRTALQFAMSQKSLQITNGWVEAPKGRQRIVVTASPVDASGLPDLYVVSFQEREEMPAQPPRRRGGGDPKTSPEIEQELLRVRTELHNAIEELQASNEEHKASAEEVMSINEELQSSNEELETSKEEMQSLNEELTTVNAQLQAKMEEHQNASNDLSALLSSTDIAVIFLDTEFRIRRFTPAAKAVAHMISTDVGRPLKDLASKFTDPDLLIDARRVLERLTPLDKEITGENLRWYVRRILPYRTVDNRIEGVVLTFVDITERKRAEEVLKKSEDLLTSELHIFAGLYDVTTRVLLASDLSTALQEILSAAIRLLGAQKGDIQLLDKGGDLVRRVASLGFSQKQQLEPSRDGLEAPWRRALVSKQRVVIPDTQDKSRSDSQRLAAIETGFRAVVSTPLRTRRDEVLGVLSTYFTDTHTPSDRELRVLDLFERHASDLIERLRIEEELTRLLRTEQSTRLALDAAAQVKDEFMATLSHELRTPLNVILLWSKALRDAPDLAVKTEAIDAIVRSAEVQARLIEDLLDTSRIASGKLRLEMRETELTSIIQSAVEAIQPTARTKGVVLEQDLDQAGTILADPERLHQVLWNLLINAVKFTPRDGRIRVEARRNLHMAEILVKDSGAGISADSLPYIFDRFRQFDAPRTATGSGLGLGLSIAKQLVELHGGTIQGDSEGPGKGSTFTIQLPLVDNQPKSSAGSEMDERLDDLDVLLIEDEAETASVVQLLLKKAGANVIGVESPKEALEAYCKARPDVIVSDIGLPDMDGYELLRKMRALDASNHSDAVPAIALTAYALERDRRAAREAGYEMHLAKPVDGKKLVRAIRKLANP